MVYFLYDGPFYSISITQISVNYDKVNHKLIKVYIMIKFI